MVVELVVGGFLNLVHGFLMPLGELDLSNLSASGGMVPGFALLNGALPLGEMVAIFGMSLAFRTWAFSWTAAVWVYRHIPFI